MVVHELTERDAYINITNESLSALQKGDYVSLNTEIATKRGAPPKIKQKVGRIACVLSSDRGVQAIGFREASAGGYDPAEIISIGRLEDTTIDVLTTEQAAIFGLATEWQQ
jgi:hypothetical protein